MTEKLLHCAHCGSSRIERIIDTGYMPDSGHTYYFIRCRNCEIRTALYCSKEEAIDAWNRRVESEKSKWNSETPNEPGQYWCHCDGFHKPAITLIVSHKDNLWIFSQGLGKDGSERLSSFCEKWQNYKLRWCAVEYPAVPE